MFISNAKIFLSFQTHIEIKLLSSQRGSRAEQSRAEQSRAASVSANAAKPSHPHKK